MVLHQLMVMSMQCCVVECNEQWLSAQALLSRLPFSQDQQGSGSTSLTHPLAAHCRVRQPGMDSATPLTRPPSTSRLMLVARPFSQPMDCMVAHQTSATSPRHVLKSLPAMSSSEPSFMLLINST